MNEDLKFELFKALEEDEAWLCQLRERYGEYHEIAWRAEIAVEAEKSLFERVGIYDEYCEWSGQA